MNKLSLVGMQLPEKYKENFDVSRRKAVARNVEIFLISKFSNESLLGSTLPRTIMKATEKPCSIDVLNVVK